MNTRIEDYEQFSDEQILAGLCNLFPFLRESFEQVSVLMIAKRWSEDELIQHLIDAKDDPEFAAMLKENNGFFDTLLRRAVRARVKLMRKQVAACNN